MGSGDGEDEAEDEEMGEGEADDKLAIDECNDCNINSMLFILLSVVSIYVSPLLLLFNSSPEGEGEDCGSVSKEGEGEVKE